MTSGMTKIVSPSGWDYGDAIVQLMKIGQWGLGENDRRDFTKRASHLFLPLLDQIKFASDEEPVHVIGMGSTEAWGANRNGDGFKEAALKAYHKTFEKFARWYRNHKNKDPNISYGVIKAAVYNQEMRRVEILCGLNRTKSAADRNGGFIADLELEKLGRGDDLAVSMACHVPFDVCSWCNNKARTRAEYCKAATCGAGGCDENLARLVKVGSTTHLLHVDNTEPRFFDLSRVIKPADRTAMGNRADWIKAAADGQFGIDGAKMAEDLGVMAPLAVMLDRLPASRKNIETMAKLAQALTTAASLPEFAPEPLLKLAFTTTVQKPIDLTSLGLDSDSREKIASGLAALAEKKVVLPLRDFARMTKRAELTEEASSNVPGAYGRMLADGSLFDRLTSSQNFPSGPPSFEQAMAAEKAAVDGSLDHDRVVARVQRSAIRGETVPQTEKRAADISPAAEELARDYACYKLAAMEFMAKAGGDFAALARACLAQDQAA